MQSEFINKFARSKVFRFFNIYRGLPKGIYILFLIRIINAMGNFVYPFLTMYLTKNMGMSDSRAGLFVTLASLAFAPGAVIGGKLSDHTGRKKIIIIFQLMTVICFIPCAFLGNSMVIPWLLILSAFFNGAAQPANGAMVNDLTNSSNRKSAFSLLYLGNNIGFAIGPMIAGFLYTHYIKWIFLGNAVSGVVAALVLIKFVEETMPDHNQIDENEVLSENEKAETGSIIRVLFRKPALLIFSMLSLVYSFVYAQYPYCIPLQVNQAFGKDGPPLYGILMSVNGLVVITMTTLVIRVTHRIRPLLNVAFAGLFFAFGFGMLYFIHSYFLYIISTIIWTLGEILNATNSGVYIANNTPISHRGRFNAVIPLITGSGFALGPLIMGKYIHGRGVREAWPLVFGLEIAAAVLIFLQYASQKRKELRNIK